MQFGWRKDKVQLYCSGAAHLPGEKGIISQLRELGYTVTPAQQK
ncbi:MAG: TraB/GumN family protein [Paludibacter sp.]